MSSRFATFFQENLLIHPNQIKSELLTWNLKRMQFGYWILTKRIMNTKESLDSTYLIFCRVLEYFFFGSFIGRLTARAVLAHMLCWYQKDVLVNFIICWLRIFQRLKPVAVAPQKKIEDDPTWCSSRSSLENSRLNRFSLCWRPRKILADKCT